MKNQMLLISLFFACAVQAEETFVMKKFVWKYTIAAKDNTNLDDICSVNAKMRTLIDDVKRGDNPGLYQEVLNFVQQVQEAIVAGLNLYGAVQTSEETVDASNVEAVIEATAEQVVEQVIEQEVNNVVAAENAAVAENIATSEVTSTTVSDEVSTVSSKDLTNILDIVDEAFDNVDQSATDENDAVVIDGLYNGPSISISIMCVINDVSQTEAWNAAIAKLQALTDAINAHTVSGAEIVSEIDAVYNILQSVQIANIELFAA